MHIGFILHIFIVFIRSQGLILKKGRSFATFGAKILGTGVFIIPFWDVLRVQNGKNDGFAKMSVELRKWYMVPQGFRFLRVKVRVFWVLTTSLVPPAYS